MMVCCETVVPGVEPEICNCLFSVFIFVVFPCGFHVFPLRLAGWGNGSQGELFLCFFLYKSLNCFKVWWTSFVLKCGALFLPIGQLFHFCVFLHVRGHTERLLFCPICWGVLLFFLLLSLLELWPVCLKLLFGWRSYRCVVYHSKKKCVCVISSMHHLCSILACTAIRYMLIHVLRYG